ESVQAIQNQTGLAAAASDEVPWPSGPSSGRTSRRGCRGQGRPPLECGLVRHRGGQTMTEIESVYTDRDPTAFGSIGHGRSWQPHQRLRQQGHGGQPQRPRRGEVGAPPASMGQVGSAGDNAAMESFFALLQKNVLDRQRWRTREELRLAIVTWIERTYHRRRRQRTLGKLTPIEFETIYTAADAA